MRRPLALLLPLLALSACGGDGARNAQPVAGRTSFDRPDGSFDRARYRTAAILSCVQGMRSENASLPAETLCTCLIDRQLEANSDAVLRASIDDDAVSRRTLDAATRQCGLPTPTDADLAPANGAAPPAEDAPPPPEEPPPAPPGEAGTPQPLVQDPPARR